MDAYLALPVEILRCNCLRPLKYLRWLGTTVLGLDGCLRDSSGEEPDYEKEDIPEGETYLFDTGRDHQGRSEGSS